MDPKFALPYAGLADYYGFSMANGILAPDENWPKCEEAVNKALALDDTLAEAYNPQAAVKLYYHRDWAAAESAFRSRDPVESELCRDTPSLRHNFG